MKKTHQTKQASDIDPTGLNLVTREVGKFLDHALAKLESLAKERGTAVGMASALPSSIERIAVWIKTLESHGIMLVPLTTAMLKSKSS